MDWKAGTDRNYDSAFDFKYDRMSRLTQALWHGSGQWRNNTRYYGYDLNGNLNSISRGQSRATAGGGQYMTTSSYSLDGNHIAGCSSSTWEMAEIIAPTLPHDPEPPIHNGNAVRGASTQALIIDLPPETREYRTILGYDDNGNFTTHRSEYRDSVSMPWTVSGISLEAQYNSLNLPSYRKSGGQEDWTVYSADGTKQALYHHTPYKAGLPPLIPSTPEAIWKFEYAGNYIFRNGVLDRISLEGGYVDPKTSVPVYQWYLTDHLGNVRVVADNSGTVSQTNHYDPYGEDMEVTKVMNSFNNNTPPYLADENLFRFGGKEWSKAFSDYRSRYPDVSVLQACD